ncbi:MAG: TolC family protein, partial [Ignavibacteria bacterium]|nr:TolC family protein [Ignavibacteria bacterium]
DEETVKNELNRNYSGLYPETNKNIVGFYDTVNYADAFKEKFLENNLQLKIKETEEKITANNMRIISYENLPKFEVGYHYEKLFNQVLQGPHLGISIPLWENKNKAAYGEAERNHKKSDIEEYKFTELSLLNSNIARAKKLELLIEQISLNIQTLRTVDILNEELSLGKITLIQYFNEINLHASLRDKQIELRKEYRILVSDILYQTEN